ncbi:hypothetical protein [Alteromonas sp. CYL-A6]|uniref:hypothetical protein n=1 Tax=Alteromonas nitratireducens TaxID=3390813 RepID=UPI0034B24070
MSSEPTVHPEIAKLEPWFADMHMRLFDTMEQAQAAVDQAEKTGHDLSPNDEYAEQLQRDFEVAVASFPVADHITSPLVQRTQALADQADMLRLHLTQIWAAGTCTLSLYRMLHAIPAHLLDDDAVSGTLKAKAAMHFKMWQHLLGE